jgi:hypothetical protein
VLLRASFDLRVHITEDLFVPSGTVRELHQASMSPTSTRRGARSSLIELGRLQGARRLSASVVAAA